MRIGRSRCASLVLFALVFAAVSFLLRAALLVRSYPLADTRPLAIAPIFFFGLLFDLLACLWTMLPLALLVILGGNRFLAGRVGRTLVLALFSVGVFLILYDVGVEWFYWGEFNCSRFNLVAVDYLRDFREVLAGIWQSYPVVPVTLGLLALTALIVVPLARTILQSCQVPLRASQRAWILAIYLAAMAPAVPLVRNLTLANTSDNWANRNLAKNGGLCFASALCNRDVTYNDLYLARDHAHVMARLRDLLKTPNGRCVGDNTDDITRRIDNGPSPTKHNVIVTVVESLSGEFLGCLGNRDGLTPNLDELAGQGVLFTRMYACGTRTIRGLEALNLSLPPTPGRALGKRPGASRLFSAERLFHEMGYRTLFFYGGEGTFDNMDQFLCSSGFELIDRRKFAPEDVHFGNAWGLCDGDTYRRAVRECDAAHASGRPFFVMIMTLSNHIPFTYPQEIDIPSGTGSPGGVKYSDYAIGQFIRQARAKPWFDDTIFVFVADHCWRRWAKSDASPVKYHIPAILYAPKIVQPRRCDFLCSQIDVMPTVLGLLNASYDSKFFGQDLLRDATNRAFVGTELNLSLLVGNHQVVLSPGCEARAVALGPDDSETPIEVDRDELDMAITYYEGAGFLLKKHLYGAR